MYACMYASCHLCDERFTHEHITSGFVSARENRYSIRHYGSGWQLLSWTARYQHAYKVSIYVCIYVCMYEYVLSVCLAVVWLIHYVYCSHNIKIDDTCICMHPCTCIVHVYRCLYVCAYVCMYVCISTDATCVYIQTLVMYVCMYACMYVWAQMHASMYMCMYTDACMYVCMYACMYV
jgi:hypothetical protein